MFFPWKDDIDKEIYSSNVYKGVQKASGILKKYMNSAEKYYNGNSNRPFNGNPQGRNQPPYNNNSNNAAGRYQPPYGGQQNGNSNKPPVNNGTAQNANPPRPPYGANQPGRPPFNNQPPAGNYSRPPYGASPNPNQQRPPYYGNPANYPPPQYNARPWDRRRQPPYQTATPNYKTEYVSKKQVKQQKKQQAAQEEDAIKKDPTMRQIVKKSAAPFYAVGICWVIYAFACPMYRWFDFLIAAAVSILVGLLAKRIFPGKKEWISVPVEPVKTGNTEIDKMFEEGKAYLEKLRKADIAIEDEVISKQIVRMEDVTKKIFDYIRENPKKAPQIRKFMNYYLPTTLKLLESYHKLDSQGVRGENISSTMHNIEGMLHTIVVAFEKQLDSLFQDEAMDISADITVLEGMLAQEGLSGSDFESEEKQDKK